MEEIQNKADSQINIDNKPFEPKRKLLFQDETLFAIACVVVVIVVAMCACSAGGIEPIQLIPDTNIQK